MCDGVAILLRKWYVLRRGLGLGAGYGVGYGVVGEGGVGGYGGDGERGRDEGMERRGGWPAETLYLGMVGMHMGICMGTVWRIEIWVSPFVLYF